MALPEKSLSRQPLEDELSDVLAKAQAGLGLGYRELGTRLGLEAMTLRRFEAAALEPELLRKIATALGLNPEASIALQQGSYHPNIRPPETVQQIVQPFRDYTVNSWLVLPPELPGGLLIDTGSRAEEIMATLESAPAAVLLTHTHPDHVGGLAAVRRRFPRIPVYCHSSEADQSMQPLTWGTEFSIGSLRVSCLQTDGHSRGGTSFFFSTGNSSVAAVGDCLFAGSVGGCAGNYHHALKMIRENIFSLPENTFLLPGHGPTTTVALERSHNPFF